MGATQSTRRGRHETATAVEVGPLASQDERIRFGPSEESGRNLRLASEVEATLVKEEDSAQRQMGFGATAMLDNLDETGGIHAIGPHERFNLSGALASCLLRHQH